MSTDFESDCRWTPAQKQAFEQIEKLMREHFEAGVFVCMAEINDHQEEVWPSYHGGKSNALGLLARVSHQFLHAEADEAMEP